MGFYSLITLACTTPRVSELPARRILEMAHGHGLLSSLHPEMGGSWPVASWLCGLFRSDIRLAENDRLFAPQSFSIGSEFGAGDLESEHCSVAGSALQFHGVGYFFPFSQADVIAEFCNHPRIAAFYLDVASTFPASFSPPEADRALLDEFTHCPRPGSWTWVFEET